MGNKILIIDDSEEIVFAISEFFKYKGWESYTAGTVEKALKILNENNLDLDAIIIDYNMPHINGVVGVRLIRQINPLVPIIALTIEEEEFVAKEFFDAGANDFAIKPIKVLDLYSRINVHIAKGNKVESIKVNDYPKGININTIELIKKEMLKTDGYIQIEEISELTGLAGKTINRYMTYLLEKNLIKIKVIYGKVGRPKNEYLWIK
ncbi:DNA-binding response regulator [Cetobacterium sp. 2A]|uniref:DNA-binding response regulator n=1 Tax=unclassified Cetobacterium TaxID=2630983 RepID=UPI00163D16EE|nr:DNA-binding response regulator [Cetobacterium sp. 2A]MBC2855022.1 DNA-binding response regulator [Cetobacterium sp. 2A]